MGSVTVFSGLSTAAGLLLGSGLVMHWLLHHQLRSELGIHFIGMGAGIFLTALFVYLMAGQISWQQHWFWLTALGSLLAIPAWIWLPRPETSSYTVCGEKMIDRPPSQKFLHTFILAYFCAGVGYAVIITLIVVHVKQLAGHSEYGSLTFMIIGLAAAPACIIWDLVARKISNLNALLMAFVLQLIGMLIPLSSPGIIWTFIGAGLFGGTFIGLVSLVLTMAGRYFPTRPAKMMGKMTLSYGVAQMAGPVGAGIFAQWTGSYDLSIIIATSIMLVGCGLTYRLRYLK
mgnify:CR=1 FL=1